jgi:hypothetical protein
MSPVMKIQQWRRRGGDIAEGGPRMSESSGERSRGAEQEKPRGSGTLGARDGMGGGQALCPAPRHRVGPVPVVFSRAGPPGGRCHQPRHDLVYWAGPGRA